MTWRVAAALAMALVAGCHRATGSARAGAITSQAEFGTGWSPDSLFYRSGGRGEAVVLLHAFSVDGRMWDSLATALAPRYRVIIPDLRGHGRTRPSSDAYSSHDDIAHLLDALRIQRAAFVGLSYGSQVAVDFAIAYPARATVLVLASSSISGYVSRDPMPFMAPVMAAARTGDTVGAARAWAATPMMSVPRDTAAQEAMTRWVVENARLWGLARTERQPSPPAIDRLDAIKVPTLVLVGGADLAAMHSVADLLTQKIRGAERIDFPGAGHMLPFTAGPAYGEAVTRFLAERLPNADDRR